MKNITVNNIVLIFIFLIVFNCKKQETKMNVLKLTELKDYKVTETKVNDSVLKVSGENVNYIIEGKMDLSNHSKQGWWTIKSKENKNWVEIEYSFLDKQFENQIKIYKDGVFDSKSSKFYNVSLTNKDYLFTFHFPKSNYNTYNVEFDYIVSDTIQKKKIREGSLKLKKNGEYYSCPIPANKNENIIGIVTRFSNFKQKDSVLLAVDRMFIKPLNKNTSTEVVKLFNPK